MEPTIEAIKRILPTSNPDDYAACIGADMWNACRAAMLQAQSDDDGEPTDDERIMAIEGIHNCERCGDEGWVIGEMGITRCACGQAGNSPVIPDGSVAMLRRWLAFGRGMQNAGSQLPHNLIAETESMLAAAPTGIPMIPDGYVMVPKEPTAEMQSAGASAIRIETTALNKLWTGNAVFRAMLAAAPQPQNAPQNIPEIIPGWIPVSERMPEKGQAVLVYRPKAHEGGDSDVRVAVYGRHNFEHGFGCYWEPSHWMPLPAAPQEVGDA
ncbi:DUF551 domain-containing protein [Klebsiella michiganensis]|uniref:DUF551 domain-containing protein n=1 Tax=Klebsiella michiganensis TaxID=1134687 RepID=UPI0031E86A41